VAKAVINATNIVSTVEEHEVRLDNVDALLSELLAVVDDLNNGQRGRKDRTPEYVESMEYMVGLLESPVVRDNVQSSPAPQQPRHPEGQESSPDKPR
jgi:hypothetical protein